MVQRGHEDTTVYKVVMNHEEQYSIWPSGEKNPLGWKDTGKTGPKDECLGYIREVWSNMLPLSFRKELDNILTGSAVSESVSENETCIQNLFEAQASRTPDGIAIICGHQHLSYRELNKKANQMAHFLIGCGVGPGVKVGICVQRSFNMVVGLLGILKAGGAYIPMDPVYPRERLASIIIDSGMSVILTESLLNEFAPNNARIVLIDSDWSKIEEKSDVNPTARTPASGIAYIIYTSGTTGMPKGVVVTHNSLWDYLQALQGRLKIKIGDIYLHTASIAFAASVRQLMLPLTTGATVIIANDEQRSHPVQLLDLIKQKSVSVLDSFPSFLQALAKELELHAPHLPGPWKNTLRLILTTGEPLPWHITKKWHDLIPDVRIFNLYGSTETTGTVIACSVSKGNDQDGVFVPVGHPIDDVQVHLLDKNMRPVAPGTVGELYLADRMALGYLNLPEQTATAFVPNPFSEKSGTRLLKTGDLARFRRDGSIELRGRADNQVSMRGYRIELEEVEAVMRQYLSLQELAVVTREDHKNEKRLVAYIVWRADTTSNIQELRDFLLQKLPGYMIPDTFISMDVMPLTLSGKVDIQALPEPDWTRSDISIPYSPPRTQIEKKVCDIFTRVLGVDRVGIDDNFFELGGHSLQAASIIARLRDTLQVELSLGSLLQAHTVGSFAQEVTRRLNNKEKSETSSLPTIIPASREEQYQPFPLTDIQQAYWIGRTAFVDLGHVSTHRYTEIESIDLDLERLNLSWQRMIERHAVLRTVFLPDGRQQVLRRIPRYEINTLDLRGKDQKTKDENLKAVRERMSHQVLSCSNWPLFEIRATRLDDRRIRLHISFDALILDVRSRFILLHEWAELYRNPDASLPELEITFRDYVTSLRNLPESSLYQKAKEYWWNRLDTLPPPPDLPLAKKPGSITHPRFARFETTLDQNMWRKLKEKAGKRGMTPSGVLLATYAEVLKVWSKSPRFSLNVTVINPLPIHRQVYNVVGQFTSVVLLAVDKSDESSFEARASRIQQQLWSDLDNNYVSGVEVLRELTRRQGGVRAEMPVVFTSALTHDLQINDPHPMSWMGNVVYSISQTPQVWLDFQAFEEGGTLVINWDAIEELFPDNFLSAMFESYCTFLRHLIDNDDIWRQSWPETASRLVPNAQLKQWKAVNSTAAPLPPETLYTLFLNTVQQHAEQTAVIASNRSITYEELYRRSNQIGRRLRELGARPNQLVAIVMEKGWEQIIAVMGILASGAAYLPIDAGLPPERLQYLLENSQAELVLTQPNIKSAINWPAGVQLLSVDGNDFGEIDDTDDTPLDPVQEPEDLAYVIYTSGSTGLPKGVMIEHRSAVNLVLDINARFNVGTEDRVLALSSLSFDLSVWDIFGMLSSGGTLVMPEQKSVRDPSRWAELIRENQVTIWNSVPALMELLVDYVSGHTNAPSLPLRLVMMSGDWIPVGLPDQIRSQIGRPRIVSLGGPTETTVWCVFYPIEEVNASWKSIPYGRPTTNMKLFVLNEALAHCPIWVPGQIYAAGIQLARGYWRNEPKTRATFIIHPHTGERLYRTGDLGRYLPDGNIEILGREDFQVQIQGYRVELGEIEATLLQHPQVSVAVVTAAGEQKGTKSLVAFIVPQAHATPAVNELRQFLRQKLPEYMVPSAFITLDEIPLTPNGKIDRKKLSTLNKLPESKSPEKAVKESDLKTRISELVASIIEIDPRDTETNLIEIGANSVHLIRIVNLLDKELGFRPDMDELLRSPTVSGLVRAYEEHRGQEPSPTAVIDSKVIGSTPDAIVSSFQLLLDPDDRETFRKQELGLREDTKDRPEVSLHCTEADSSLQQKYMKRRSYRAYSSEAIPFQQFSNLLSYLYQINIDGIPKRLYASAGGLYPVQTYLYVKPERIEALEDGIYYYHPVSHRLVLLSSRPDFDRGVYSPFINRPTFDESAFAIFLVAQMAAIAPMYGERSVHYATLEAGIMAHLLETAAPDYGIGLCQIGDLDFDRIKPLFHLDKYHLIIHSLVGGKITSSQGQG